MLLTGATGFLGAHLLADWLTHSDAVLHCLVRAGSAQAALDRVRANLTRYGRGTTAGPTAWSASPATSAHLGWA